MKKTGGRRFDRQTEGAKGGKPPSRPPMPPRAKSQDSDGKPRDAAPRVGVPRVSAPKAGAPAGASKAGAPGRAFRRPSAELAVLYGYHAVREALRAKRRVCLDLFATAPAAEKLAEEIAASGVFVHIVESEALFARLGQDSVHQGVLLEARPLPELDISEIVVGSGLVLALDQITDPHNVGAILRTAAAFSVDAIIATDRHAPEFSGVLAKAASGGLEHVPIVEVVNLARALEQLGAAGYFRVGLDSEGQASLEKTPLTRPTVLVLGAEGKGLRRLTREKCDALARLDMPGAIKSLNVSNACAVALTIAYAMLNP
jgi:23S rRNA (guanosine2251-2'-O)-methyltransferase